MVLITEPGNSSGFYMHGGFDMRSTNWDLWWLSLEAPEEEELVTGRRISMGNRDIDRFSMALDGFWMVF